MEIPTFVCDQCKKPCAEALLLKIKGKRAEVNLWDDDNQESKHLCASCLKKALHF
jgi:hypothetical protein